MKESVVLLFGGVEKLLPYCRTFWKLSWLKPLNIFPSPLFYLIPKNILHSCPDWIFLLPESMGSSKSVLYLLQTQLILRRFESYLSIEIQYDVDYIRE
jgi:hypothetical protein